MDKAIKKIGDNFAYDNDDAQMDNDICPFGHKIGIDHDRHEACDHCDDVHYDVCGGMFKPTT